MMSANIPKISLPTPELEGTPMPRMSPIKSPEEFRETARPVLFSETDINGHLTNTRYVDWICDLAPMEFHRDHPMRGLRINYRAETFPGENVPLRGSLDDTRLWCASPSRFEAEISF
jgi:acyl-ACP thioesterase